MGRNTKIALIFGGFVTAVGVAFYPIFFHPLTHVDEYSKCKRYTWLKRSFEGKPLGVKIWSDPFKSK
uniref:Small integral membrane protein 20 n=1 Tax=Lepisosteus oculatus TaxID=7918 RepID=W5MU41_LEPOC